MPYLDPKPTKTITQTRQTEPSSEDNCKRSPTPHQATNTADATHTKQQRATSPHATTKMGELSWQQCTQIENRLHSMRKWVHNDPGPCDCGVHSDAEHGNQSSSADRPGLHEKAKWVWNKSARTKVDTHTTNLQRTWGKKNPTCPTQQESTCCTQPFPNTSDNKLSHITHCCTHKRKRRVQAGFSTQKCEQAQ